MYPHPSLGQLAREHHSQLLAQASQQQLPRQQLHQAPRNSNPASATIRRVATADAGAGVTALQAIGAVARPGASRQSGGRRLQLWRRFSVIILAVVSAASTSFCGVVFVSQPQVPTLTAQEFFSDYYRQVTQAGDRKALYREDLTPNFKSSIISDWQDYNNWWKGWNQVAVEQVESDSGNPLEFNVWLRYYSVHGQLTAEEDGFTLVCSGFWASLEARMPALGCPAGHLQFQSQLFKREIN